MKLLQIMSDGDFHSGDEIGRLLGISRAAVWKRIQKLSEAGIIVQSVKGKGYRLADSVEMLNAEFIKDRVKGFGKVFSWAGELDLDVFDVVTSTNDVALSKPTSDDRKIYFCLAEQQTQGRGRRGREWVSPYARNIYMSCLWRCQTGVASLEGLSLAVGLAVVSAFDSLDVGSFQLKWPNDILLRNEKVAGILLEMIGDPSGQCSIVIGVGVNTSLSAEERSQISQPCTDLKTHHFTTGRNELAARLVWNLIDVLQRFQDEGFQAFRESWLKYDALRDKPVTLSLGNQVKAGVARGVDNAGALIFESETGTELIRAGEVTIRVADVAPPN